MATTSPSARSLKKLRDDGWTVDTVERRVPGRPGTRPTTRDLFGIGDLIAVRADVTLLVQVTSGSNVAARVKKIAASPLLEPVKVAGWQVVVHGWRKNPAGRWIVREVEC